MCIYKCYVSSYASGSKKRLIHTEDFYHTFSFYVVVISTLYLTGTIHTAKIALSERHEQIILGSAGLWSLLSADDAVLYGHFLLKVLIQCCHSAAKEVYQNATVKALSFLHVAGKLYRL